MPRVEREASLVRPLSLMRLADNRQPCWGHAQRVPTVFGWWRQECRGRVTGRGGSP